MKFVVASDSFKDSLSSEEVNSALSIGIREALPEAQVVAVALGDGGEGTGGVLLRNLGGIRCESTVSDPLGRQIRAGYGLVDTQKGVTAIIEMAEASGLQLLKNDERNAMRTSSTGLGELILHAYKAGARRFVICIGGSATNDGGTGMLSALGFRFFNSKGELLNPCGQALNEIDRIDRSGQFRKVTECDFTIICDVTNPLYGPEGAAYVYGPQKGATPEEVTRLDDGLRNFGAVIERETGKQISMLPGTGAAGGVGAAFKAFFNAELKPGVDTILELVNFDSLIDGAALVITGEGRIDGQTMCGKLPSGVCRRAHEAGVPVVAIAGSVESVSDLLKNGFDGVFPILSSPMSLAEALRPETAKENIIRLGMSLGRLAHSLTKPENEVRTNFGA